MTKDPRRLLAAGGALALAAAVIAALFLPYERIGRVPETSSTGRPYPVTTAWITGRHTSTRGSESVDLYTSWLGWLVAGLVILLVVAAVIALLVARTPRMLVAAGALLAAGIAFAVVHGAAPLAVSVYREENQPRVVLSAESGAWVLLAGAVLGLVALVLLLVSLPSGRPARAHAIPPHAGPPHMAPAAPPHPGPSHAGPPHAGPPYGRGPA